MGASGIRRSLIWKVTLPTVVLVLVLSLAAAQVLAALVRTTHEEGAEQRARRVAGVVAEVVAAAMARGHTDVGEQLAQLCRTAGKQAFLADRGGKVKVACDRSLLGTRIAIDRVGGTAISHGGARWVRYVEAVPGGAACTRCHGAARPLGYVAIDSPLAEAEEEVRSQQQMNLLAGGVTAVALSLLLVLVQVVLVHRPVRMLTATVERIRGGDLAARAPAARGDEIGVLAQALNGMAAGIEQAKAELDRTYRQELAQAEKLAALGQLTSSIAHEIKNPLSGIIGALKVLEAEAAPGDPNKAILGKVLAQTERLAKTAVELLDFARPLKAAVSEVDLADLLDRTIFFVERQAAAQRVELRRRYGPGLPQARVDPDLVKQVFLNLLLNGIQAMPGGGALEIEARSVEPAALEVVFRDQGVGVAPENLERIFSPFFSTKNGGTGLGLYVARQMVETQRGQIRVESRLGRGTAFTVRLPAVEPAEEGKRAD